MKKEIPRGRSGNSPRMLLNVDGVENSTLGQRHPSFVPQGHLRIARRFNAGLAGYETQVPKGRLTGAQYEVLSPTPVLDKISFGLFLNERSKNDHLARNRFSMSATTSSKARPRSGCCRISSARRSSSAICSGVNSSSNSPNSWRIFSTTSCCSSGGNCRICSEISAALMLQDCSNLHSNQAGTARPVHSAFRIPHSAFK